MDLGSELAHREPVIGALIPDFPDRPVSHRPGDRRYRERIDEFRESVRIECGAWGMRRLPPAPRTEQKVSSW